MASTLTTGLVERISDWMKQRVEEAGARGIVLGLSGGIDSAVVAGLAKRAVGDQLLGVLMPCHSSPSAAEHAFLVAEAFGIETVTVDLTAPYDALIAALPAGSEMANANIRPRLRMTTLYHVAQSRNYLVAGTGNKSEFLVGYFTKWGDGGVDMMPIASLYKRDVRILASELGVPPVIIEKPPSADLWPGQTDEAEMGIPYETLDRLLEALEAGDTSGFEAADVRRVREMMGRSEHKRLSVPMFQRS